MKDGRWLMVEDCRRWLVMVVMMVWLVDDGKVIDGDAMFIVFYGGEGAPGVCVRACVVWHWHFVQT